MGLLSSPLGFTFTPPGWGGRGNDFLEGDAARGGDALAASARGGDAGGGRQAGGEDPGSSAVTVLIPSQAIGALNEHFPLDKLGGDGPGPVDFVFEEAPHGPFGLSGAEDDAARVGPTLHGVIGRSATDFGPFV